MYPFIVFRSALSEAFPTPPGPLRPRLDLLQRLYVLVDRDDARDAEVLDRSVLKLQGAPFPEAMQKWLAPDPCDVGQVDPLCPFFRLNHYPVQISDRSALHGFLLLSFPSGHTDPMIAAGCPPRLGPDPARTSRCRPRSSCFSLS